MCILHFPITTFFTHPYKFEVININVLPTYLCHLFFLTALKLCTSQICTFVQWMLNVLPLHNQYFGGVYFSNGQPIRCKFVS